MTRYTWDSDANFVLPIVPGEFPCTNAMITLHRTRSTASGEPLANDRNFLRSRLDITCHVCCTCFHNCIKDSFHLSISLDNVSDCESLFYIASQNRASLFRTNGSVLPKIDIEAI